MFSSDSLDKLPRTKIVATVGPACNTREQLLRLAQLGVSVFRLNFSHGTHEDHGNAIQLLRGIESEIERPIALLADLCGPKIRIDPFPGDPIPVYPGDTIFFSSIEHNPKELVFRIGVPQLDRVLKPGAFVLVDDGLLRFRVDHVIGERVVCQCVNRGYLRPRKGVNLPGSALPIEAMTEKDREDLVFALSSGVDIVALSFVRHPDDLAAPRAVMASVGKRVPLIAKIEMAEAIDHLDEIIQSADGAMVARGDLGVELPIEKLPAVQQRIIERCNKLGKPVITATQMLNSMMTNPSPTRAEVTDIYNAIHEGTDAVMLSGETASGEYPALAVEMMARVAREAEDTLGWNRNVPEESGLNYGEAVAESLSAAAIALSEELGLHAIVCATTRGTTARRLARHRPRRPVLALSTEQKAVRELCLVWGVQPRLMRHLSPAEVESGGDSHAIIDASLGAARDEGLVHVGDRVVVVAGLPLGISGRTNFLHVIEIEPDPTESAYS